MTTISDITEYSNDFFGFMHRILMIFLKLLILLDMQKYENFLTVWLVSINQYLSAAIYDWRGKSVQIKT